MRKIIVSGLVASCIFCGAGVSDACHYTVQEVATSSWTDGGVVHDYTFYKYIDSPSGVTDKGWSATQTWVTNNASGYHLATITSAEESAAITGSGIFNNNTFEIWLGASKSASGSWQNDATWVSHETWVFHQNNWNNGEPNDYGGAEDYLGMYTNSMLWNDEGNSGNIWGFLVEKETVSPVPEPATMLLFGSGLIGLAAAGRRKLK